MSKMNLHVVVMLPIVASLDQWTMAGFVVSLIVGAQLHCTAAKQICATLTAVIFDKGLSEIC